MFFLVRYCRMLEEGSFRGRPADFLLMLLFGGALMCAVAPFINIPPFLGSSLAFMMVYVWARRNEYVRMSFLGLFQFRAPYLPWVLLASPSSRQLSSIDLMGIATGHVYLPRRRFPAPPPDAAARCSHAARASLVVPLDGGRRCCRADHETTACRRPGTRSARAPSRLLPYLRATEGKCGRLYTRGKPRALG